MTRLRLGTRGSALARAQSGWVAGRLRELHPDLEVELVVIETSGDRFSLEQPAAGPAGPAAGPPDPPNVKAMFVKEIEAALLKREVDLAVHSAKDLPAELPSGLILAAIPEREDPRDVLIAEPPSWKGLAHGTVLGTASLRRRLQLGFARPDLAFEAVRGNVDTRLRKLKEGRIGGLVLAAAGLKRLGIDVPREPIDASLLVPAPGQGALAVEACRDRPEVLSLLEPLEDSAARREVELERAFLRKMGGGCSTPLGALARCEGGAVSLMVFWSDPEGRRPRRVSGRAASPEELSSLVESLAAQLR